LCFNFATNKLLIKHWKRRAKIIWSKFQSLNRNYLQRKKKNKKKKQEEKEQESNTRRRRTTCSTLMHSWWEKVHSQAYGLRRIWIWMKRSRNLNIIQMILNQQLVSLQFFQNSNVIIVLFLFSWKKFASFCFIHFFVFLMIIFYLILSLSFRFSLCFIFHTSLHEFFTKILEVLH